MPHRLPRPLRATLAAAALVVLAGPALASGPFDRFAVAVLDGFQEVPAAIFTDGRGFFFAQRRSDRIDYVLSYSGLGGDVTAAAGAHIHFGRPGINGGIIAFLCTAAVPGPPGTPPCVDDGDGSGVVHGSIRDDDVLPVAAQGFPGGSLDDLWRALQAGAGYVNVHTSDVPSGEIRGAIHTR